MTEQKHTPDASTSDDETLSALYKNSKENQSSPRAIRRNIILAARKEELASSTLGRQLKRWANTSKVLLSATAVIALVAVVWVGQYKLQQGGFDSEEYTRVQIHTLSPAPELASENIRLKYDAAYADFLQQQGTLTAHHQSSAKLQMTNDGWTLATCQNELLKISDELLRILNDTQRVNIDLHAGDSVNILFAMDGRILQILKLPKPLRC